MDKKLEIGKIYSGDKLGTMGYVFDVYDIYTETLDKPLDVREYIIFNNNKEKYRVFDAGNDTYEIIKKEE